MKDSISNEQKTKPSHLQFQMWDKHLTLLNKIWDLETTIASLSTQIEPEQPETHFHTTLWNQHLLTLNQTWHVPSTLVLSPPSSLLGKLLSPVKKLILRWIQPSIDVLIQQQNDYNSQVVQTCNGIVDAVNNDAIRKLKAQRELNAKLIQSFNGFVELVSSELERLRRELYHHLDKFQSYLDEFQSHLNEFQSHLNKSQVHFDSRLEQIVPRVDELQMIVWTFDRRKEALEIDQILLNQKLEQVLSIVRDQEQQPADEKTDAKLPDQERQHDYQYLLFENIHRGDEATVKKRQADYVAYFQNCAHVLDIGCGRGEFLELLRESDIPGYGVEMNQTMVHHCRQKGLNVEEGDIFSHLQSLPDNSLDGIFIAQVVEHYALKELHHLLKLCFDKLQHQKYVVVETQNPRSLYALSQHFYKDLSHAKPLHPDGLQHLIKTIGFQDAHVEYKTLWEPRFQELDTTNVSDEALRSHIFVLNKNIRQLNDLIYGYVDYAIIARKGKIL